MYGRSSKFRVLLGPEDKVDAGYESSPDDEEECLSRKKTAVPDEMGFEKIGETNVYKRTRQFQPQPKAPTLERWPSNLQLSGTKFFGKEKTSDDLLSRESTSLSRRSTSQPNMAQTNGTPPPIPASPRYSRQTEHYQVRMSGVYLTDFGLKSQRTDTFSGYGRRKRDMDSSEIEKQMREKAKRHIYAYQIMRNAKRGSRAQQSYLNLKNTVSPIHFPKCSPIHSPFSVSSQDSITRSFIRNQASLDRSDSGMSNKTSKSSLFVHIRAKNIGILPRFNKPSSDPLPEISGRTLVMGSGDDI